jgi:hypothetical protein
VTSDFYPALRRYCRALTDAWPQWRTPETADETWIIEACAAPDYMPREVWAVRICATLRLVDAGALAPILQHSLATNVPLSKTGSDSTLPIEFSPRGCIVDDNPEKTTPKNLPSGEWLHGTRALGRLAYIL